MPPPAAFTLVSEKLGAAPLYIYKRPLPQSWIKPGEAARGKTALTSRSAQFLYETMDSRALNYGIVGSAVPDLDCTSATSELLIEPFAVTSSRKFVAVTGCPDWDWV